MAKRGSGERYAQAIFELAVQQDQLEAWLEQLQFADQVLQDGDFRALLTHAEVPLQRKQSAIESVLENVDPLVKNLVALLMARGAVDLIHDVREGYSLLLDRHRGRQRAAVTSAVVLDDQELAGITQFTSDLIGKEVVVSTEVDESILGGVIIQIGDQLLDGSTRTRLEELRKQIRAVVPVAGS